MGRVGSFVCDAFVFYSLPSMKRSRRHRPQCRPLTFFRVFLFYGMDHVNMNTTCSVYTLGSHLNLNFCCLVIVFIFLKFLLLEWTGNFNENACTFPWQIAHEYFLLWKTIIWFLVYYPKKWALRSFSSTLNK